MLLKLADVWRNKVPRGQELAVINYGALKILKILAELLFGLEDDFDLRQPTICEEAVFAQIDLINAPQIGAEIFEELRVFLLPVMAQDGDKFLSNWLVNILRSDLLGVEFHSSCLHLKS